MDDEKPEQDRTDDEEPRLRREVLRGLEPQEDRPALWPEDKPRRRLKTTTTFEV